VSEKGLVSKNIQPQNEKINYSVEKLAVEKWV
jgi:hypothetical protein